MLFQCLLKLNRRPGHQQLGERGIISHVLKLAKSFSLSGNISHAAKNLPVRAPKKIAFEVQNTFFLGGGEYVVEVELRRLASIYRRSGRH